MRVSTLMCLVVVVAMTACKTHKPVPVDTTEAPDIPREVALQKLGELLPTAEWVHCTLPKHSLKPSEITNWAIRSDAIEMEVHKSKSLVLNYADITAVRLELIGKMYTTRVFTSLQADREKDHFEFQWRVEEKAKSAVELLTSLKKR